MASSVSRAARLLSLVAAASLATLVSGTAPLPPFKGGNSNFQTPSGAVYCSRMIAPWLTVDWGSCGAGARAWAAGVLTGEGLASNSGGPLYPSLVTCADPVCAPAPVVCYQC